MISTLVTERLKLRPIELADAAHVVNLFNSPDWVKYIGDRGIRTVAQAEDFLKAKALTFFKEYGWGTYIVIDRETNALVGNIGLYERPELKMPDFGYAILPEFYGKGYATEASRALLKAIDTQLEFPFVYAIVMAENKRSVRVLDKLNFKPDGHVMIQEEMLQRYKLTF